MKKNLAILDEFEFQITITINQYVAITNNNSYLLSFSTATKNFGSHKAHKTFSLV